MKNHRKSEECTKIKMIHIQRLVVFISIALCGALLFMNINGDNLEKEKKRVIQKYTSGRKEQKVGLKNPEKQKYIRI